MTIAFQAYFWLSISGISLTKQNTLIQQADGVEQLYSQWHRRKDEWVKSTGDKTSILTRFCDTQYLQDSIARLQDGGIDMLTVQDVNYPYLLKNIYDPPNLLYYKGNIDLVNRHCVAVVGTRHSSRYGQTVAKNITADLCDCGVVVVSGLASGIDSCVHRAALERQGNTIAVLGGGFYHIHPSNNTDLARQIGTSNLLLSEYPPQTTPMPYMFLARNRIVSGISKGVVVVEAGHKSGARVTADIALDQGRSVYAVPGPVNSPQSIGTNQLIKEGAMLVCDGMDVANDLGLIQTITKKENSIQLDMFEQKIYDALQCGIVTVDCLTDQLKVPIRELTTTLALMELKGIITKHPGNSYGL